MIFSILRYFIDSKCHVMITKYLSIIVTLSVILFATMYGQNANAQISTQNLNNSTITAILNGFNPTNAPITTTSYVPPSGCTIPSSSTLQGSINKIQCGLYASDSLNNATLTQQQLQANQKYWVYGGDAPAENAPYAYYEDPKGLYIGVQAPANGTYAGYYAVTPSSNAQLFHAVLTSPQRTIPYGDFQNGLYVQTTQAPVNYVTCVAITNNQATVWAIVHTYGSPFGSLAFQTLWYDPSDNQPLTRDCTIITNGQNYLKVYLDNVLVYSNSALALGMPAPFNAFLEPQSSYDGAELFGTYSNFYSTLSENAKVINSPSSAATAEVLDSSANILASSPILFGNATLDVGKYDFPINANVRVFDSNNAQIASTPLVETVYGGDVYSVVSNSNTGTTSNGSSSGMVATSYNGRAYGTSVTSGSTSQTFADTGQLPSQGGEKDADLITLDANVVQAEDLHSVTIGFDNKAQSVSAISAISLLSGTLTPITADFIESISNATCTISGVGLTGGMELDNLVVAGQSILATGQVNQTITIPGSLSVIVNEQIRSANTITVNALHLTTSTGQQITIASSSSGISCASPQPVTKDFMTGDGFIIVNNAKTNFGFVTGYKPHQNTVSGNLNYIDHGTNMHVKAVDVTSYGGTGKTRTFTGDATINGQSGFTYTVTATDNGEPGKGTDTFSIKLSNGYSANGILAGGNIRLHA